MSVNSSKYLRHCTKAEIYDNEDELICQARVSMDAGGGLLVLVPRSFNYQELGLCKTIFFDPMLGLVTCKCAFSSPLLLPEQMLSLRCQIMEQLSAHQRRDDIKLPLSAQTSVSLDGGEEEPVPAVIRTISAGGVYLTTSMPARKGDQLTFDFPQADGAIPLTAEVLRVELRPPQKGRLAYGYGCRFVRLSSRHEAQLRSYVFKEESGQRKH